MATSNFTRNLISEPLARTQLFASVSPQLLDEIAEHTVRLFFRKGEAIVRQGEPGDRMFIIIEGSARVFITSADEEEVVLSLLGPSDTFGELTLLDAGPRSASVEATSPTVVFALGRNELREMLRTDHALVEAMLQSLTRTVRKLTDHTADAVFFDVHQRVAGLILDLATEKGGKEEGTLQLDLRRTEEELADILGRSRQSVAQVLVSFEQMGCLELRDHVIYLRNPDMLRQQMSAEMTWAELANKALHDPLTRLANRRLFGDRVSSAVSRAQRQGKPLGIIFLDLDDFKQVNDVYGHAAGDHLLCAVADRLRECVRKQDTAARFGGDEFGVLLEDLAAGDDGIQVAERIVTAIAQPFDIAEGNVICHASVGLTVWDGKQDISPAELFHQADTAMYRAKERGKGCFQLYSPSLSES